MTQALLDKIVLDDAMIEAVALPGSLVQGLNSDVSMRQLSKGPHRPLKLELDRAFVLAGLSSASPVALFDERTPVPLLYRVPADIYVKGGNCDMMSLDETAAVRSWGGRSLAIPFADGHSTTSLVRRVRGDGA